MDFLTQENFIMLLRSALCGAPVREDFHPDEAALQALFALSDRHDMAYLVSDALYRGGLASDSPAGQKLRERQLIAVLHCEQRRETLRRLSAALEGEKIPFLPLKGAVLQEMYPAPWMRTSSDIDVLVRESDLNAAVAALEQTLGCRASEKSFHDVAMTSENGVHVELHFVLATEGKNAAADRVLRTVWARVQPKNGREFEREMPDDLFYFYHIAHMARHFLSGGCGVRSFADLWVLEHRVTFDPAARDALLRAGGLMQFAAAARGLSEMWFSGRDDPSLAPMAQYILGGGTFGTIRNAVAAGQGKRGGRAGFFLSRLILPYDTLRVLYPALEGRRWLTAGAEVYRWFDILRSGRGGYAARELRLSGEVTDSERAEIAKLIKELGL